MCWKNGRTFKDRRGAWLARLVRRVFFCCWWLWHDIFLHAAWFLDASGSSWKEIFFHTVEVDPLMGFTKTSREGFNKIPMGHSLELVGKWVKRPAALVAWGSEKRTWSKKGQVILVVLRFFFWMPRITNWNEGAGQDVCLFVFLLQTYQIRD